MRGHVLLELLGNNQKLGTPAQGDLRTYPFGRFPYTILYAEDRLKGPQVFAIAHQSREPGYWRDRT